MVDPENWLSVRWRALWLAREYQLVYTYGEHVLLALLENPTAEVVRILQGLGEDPVTLRADVQSFAEALVPTRRASDGWGEETEIQNAAHRLAQADGYYERRPEHLLLAIVSPLRLALEDPKLIEAGRFLISRGISPQAIHAAIRPPLPAEQAMKTYEPTQKDLWLGEGWKAAAADFESRARYPRFAPGPYEFRQLMTQLQSAGEWGMLAHLFELMAAAKMLAGRGAAYAAQHLIMAAHLLRKAGDHDRARLIAQRVIHELRGVHIDGKPNPETLAEPIHVAFAWEMMGDAAICFDPNLARTYWLRAIEEFRYVDDMTQNSEWNEPWDHGWYLSDIHRYFLSGDSPDFGTDGEARVTEKMEQWLGPQA